MSDNPKLEWMYKTGKDLINREEYLTGRKVDKQFEELSAGQGEQNCVEHEVLPASISRKKDAFEDRDQVDILRKQMEDPLMAIKQKEMEARRKILENPVRLKEMYRLLKEEKVNYRKLCYYLESVLSLPILGTTANFDENYFEEI